MCGCVKFWHFKPEACHNGTTCHRTEFPLWDIKFTVSDVGRTLRLVDMNTGHCRDAESHSGGVTVASFSRNGKLLATAAGNEILVWRP